eukprot:8006727-Lingulodinium_polyedra.AAC.1
MVAALKAHECRARVRAPGSRLHATNTRAPTSSHCARGAAAPLSRPSTSRHCPRLLHHTSPAASCHCPRNATAF